MHTKIEHCRLCDGRELAEIVSLGDQALTGIFPKPEEPEITQGPLTIVRCTDCGLVQLEHSYALGDLYGAHYGYRSGLNSSMVEHLRRKVQDLLAKYPAKAGDLVIDIGANDGTTLGFYPEEVERVGFDPSAEKFRHYYKPGIKLITDFFAEKTFRKEFGGRKAKIITSIAMFYDLEEPQKFVNEVAALLADDGVWHFEQSYLPSMLEANAYDTICHEHLEYYGLRQVERMLKRAGLKVAEVQLNDVNGGSFAVTAAKASAPVGSGEENVRKLIAREEQLQLDSEEGYTEFVRFVQQHKVELMELLHRLKQEGKKVLGYGASTKGNVLLQHCGITTDVLPCIAEVNPDKFGSITPGTRIPIISEKEAHAMEPDYFVVFPWHFRANIMKREQPFLQRGGKLIFPLPQIETVGS